MFNAELILSASAKKNKKQKVAPNNIEIMEESFSERKSTGKKGGNINRKPLIKLKLRPIKKPTAIIRRAALNKLIK
jgi:hypothetical protein